MYISIFLLLPLFFFLLSSSLLSSDNDHGDKARASHNIKLRKPFILKSILDAVKPEQCLIFCRTKIDCDNLEQFFQQFTRSKVVESPYACVVLHGDRLPRERRENLEKFKKGEVKLLICTDVAARGIDISQLPCCISFPTFSFFSFLYSFFLLMFSSSFLSMYVCMYVCISLSLSDMTLPDNEEDYIHRSGRVGRQDRWGLSISLVANAQEKVWYHTCPSRGKQCQNTRLKDDGGCCIWFALLLSSLVFSSFPSFILVYVYISITLLSDFSHIPQV